jgi:hypothetical protein
MAKWWLSLGVTVTLLALVWAVSVALAQEPGNDPKGGPSGDTATGSDLIMAPAGGPNETHAFSYQGRLIIGGSPANGNYDFYVYLYTAETGGTYLGMCDNMNSPDNLTNQPVWDGIFTFHLLCGGWNSDVFTGGSRWLEIWFRPHGVGSYTQLPRQPISPTPYAWSLYPGATINGSVSSPSAVISATQSYVSSNAFALYGYSEGETGVYGRGYYYGVRGFGNYAGLRGQGGLIGLSGNANMYGVYGYAALTSGNAYGVYGWTDSTSGIGVFGYGKGGAGGKFTSYSGSLIEGWEDVTGDGYSNLQRRFRVSYSGNVYADGGYNCGNNVNDDDSSGDLSETELDPCLSDNTPADFAEVLPTTDDPQPGDVLVVNPDGRLTPSTEPYQTNVVGVYSTRPSYVGGAANLGQEGYAPLTVVGLVPVKASAENGPILPGDLLTTSSTPGHAMRAGANPPVGSVIGKALEPLDEGTGVIQMLVMLQ